jgi:hypothetical protein
LFVDFTKKHMKISCFWNFWKTGTVLKILENIKILFFLFFEQIKTKTKHETLNFPNKNVWFLNIFFFCLIFFKLFKICQKMKFSRFFFFFLIVKNFVNLDFGKNKFEIQCFFCFLLWSWGSPRRGPPTPRCSCAIRRRNAAAQATIYIKLIHPGCARDLLSTSRGGGTFRTSKP